MEEIIMAGSEALPQFVAFFDYAAGKLAGSRLAHEPEGLPSTEQAALALRFTPEDHEELIRKGEEFIKKWSFERGG